VAIARDIAATKPLAKQLSGELAPGPQVESEAEMKEWIRGNLSTIYHPVGTCAMGGDSPVAASKLNSVVDTQLKVRGVDRLRVVDASVMPTVPRGNTNAPTIALAERAADLIQGRAPLAPLDPADSLLATAGTQ
jgi:choline dehydrogenase